MNMENVHKRAISIKPNGKNYLVECINAMVRKVEDNKERTHFWVNIILVVSMAFLPWLGLKLVDMGRMEAKQEFYKQQAEDLKQTIEAQKKEIESLKLQQSAEDVKTVQPKPKPKPAQQTRNRNRLNGSANQLRAYPNFRVEKIKGSK